MADSPITLYQAEWCPFSAAVREVLTELGIDYVARQVEPWPEQRARLRAAAGTDRIPVLEAEDGTFYRGTREIFAYLGGRERWPFADAHRRRYVDHRDARESDAPGQLLEHFGGSGGLEEADGPVSDADVVDVPERSRYELRLGGRLVGEAAYRLHAGRITFTHTEVAERLANRGFGSRLVTAALDDVRRRGLVVLPLCPFVARFIGRHPEYEDLLTAEYRQAGPATPG